ncbi:MAG TPA: acyl-CoA dehydrogenase family protein [Candidatus Krumholzibacteria bacterium]|nr:acyl-CoA dehydrogenase family protein [Candidatus Krumholzibacteria bacterium]
MSRSFARGAFTGELSQDLLFPFPSMGPDEAEVVQMLRESIRKYAAEHIDDARIDAEGAIPRQVLDTLAGLGVMGIIIPPEYGGSGLSVTAYCKVLEEISRHSAAVAVTVGAHQSIGMKAIILYGTEAQKHRFLPALAAGEKYAAFALTEPGAGSDAGSIQTSAVADGDAWVLNGTKQWITNAGFADVFTVFAKVDLPSARNENQKVTCFVVTRDLPGVVIGPPEKKIGIRGSETNEVHLENVRVPADHLLGEVGGGFKIAMGVLNEGRLGLATGCVGASRQLIELAAEFARQRRQFGHAIAEFELVKDKLAEMSTRTWTVESATYLTAGIADRGLKDFSLEAAICKILGSETLWFVVNEALQIHGGNGFMEEYPFGRMLRDARINLIFEGTNEILRLFIAGMGLRGPGEELQLVARALRHPARDFGVLSRYFGRRVEQTFLRERLRDIHPELAECASRIETAVHRLPGHVEGLLRRHGRSFVARQYLLRRIADVVIDTYAMVAVTSRTDTLLKAGASCAQELAMTRSWCNRASRRVRRNLRGLVVNADALTTEVADRILGETPWFQRNESQG